MAWPKQWMDRECEGDKQVPMERVSRASPLRSASCTTSERTRIPKTYQHDGCTPRQGGTSPVSHLACDAKMTKACGTQDMQGDAWVAPSGSCQ